MIQRAQLTWQVGSSVSSANESKMRWVTNKLSQIRSFCANCCIYCVTIPVYTWSTQALMKCFSNTYLRNGKNELKTQSSSLFSETLFMAGNLACDLTCKSNITTRLRAIGESAKSETGMWQTFWLKQWFGIVDRTSAMRTDCEKHDFLQSRRTSIGGQHN